MLTFRFVLWNILLLLVAAITLGMMGLVLSSGSAVFALLDWTAFGRDQFEVSVCCASSEVSYGNMVVRKTNKERTETYHGGYSCSRGGP
jgi:hypothetical protein